MFLNVSLTAAALVRRAVGAGLLAICAASPLSAHEFWLEPATFAPRAGETVPISILIGEHFKGNSYPFLREEFKRFAVIDAKGEKPVKGIDGDDPALRVRFSEPGLSILVHYSTPETLVMEWDLFTYYLRLEGLDHIEPLHRAENKPMSKIKEIYSRCAKLLLSIGSEGGEDKLIGMPLELVAEKSPYRLAPGEPLPVRLYFNGKPIKDIQIAAISKAEPNKRLTVRTDSDGRARIDVAASGAWLLNAVHMMQPNAGEKAKGAHWASLWASMTFARP